VNLANIELRGAQAQSSIEQSANMRRYQGKSDYNATMQQAVLQQYASDLQRANIINEGNMNMYAGMSKAYQAKAQANAALVGGISDGVMAGIGQYGAQGNSFTAPKST
jgi:multidrug resistance efflux pump